MEGVFKPTLNLGNSVIGVGILAMPYCIEKCGLVLGLILLGLSATFTIWSLKMLVRSAQLTHKSSYEQLAHHTFGRHGKLVIELSIIGLTIGCLISFFIVIGDLAPPIVAKSLGISWSPSYLRMVLMTFFAFAISLPLSLLRNVESLSAVAIVSLFFYSCLLIRIVLMSFAVIVSMDAWKAVSFVKFDGLLHCLPICALALSCHPQMFVIYLQMADPSIRKMSTVINGSIYMVTTGYGLMAFFGYLIFVRDGVKGDVLKNFPHDGISQMFRFGFSMSVVVSFPLVVFPVRASIYSLLFSKQSSGADLHGVEPIPPGKFNGITVAIIIGTLTIALLVPNVEAVLALTGATTGSIVSYIFPSLIFLSVVGAHAPFSHRAKFLAVLGVLVMVVGTATIVNEHMRGDDTPPISDYKDFPRPFVPQAQGPVALDDDKLKSPVAPQLPGADGRDVIKNDIIKNDVIGDDVIQKEEVHVPAVKIADPGVSEEGKKNEEAAVKEAREEGKVEERKEVGERGEGGHQEEHNSIRKDMEELKERIKAVEEENKELKDVLNQKDVKQLPVDENQDHVEDKKEEVAAPAPDTPEHIAPPEKVQSLLEEAEQPQEGVGLMDVAKQVELKDPLSNVVEQGKRDFGVVDGKVMEQLSVGKKREVPGDQGVGGGPPVGGAEEVKQEEVLDKREVRGEKEEEEKGEKAVEVKGDKVEENLAGGGEKAAARELKALDDGS